MILKHLNNPDLNIVINIPYIFDEKMFLNTIIQKYCGCVGMHQHGHPDEK